MSLRLLLVSFLSMTPFLALAATREETVRSKAEMQYADAAAAQKTVADLTSKTIPTDLKTLLLERVRSEDKDYAKNLIVRWKPMSARTVQNEFDAVVIRNTNGVETMRIRKMPGSTDTMILDGRAWKIPTSGSLEKSLRRHFAETESAAIPRSEKSIFAFILSPKAAQAAEPSAEKVKAAYLYVTTIQDNNSSIRAKVDPASYASTSAGRPVIHNRNGVLGYIFSRKFFFDPAIVSCEGSNAKGKATVDGEHVRFESREDGTVIFTMNDKNKTKLLYTSRTVDPRPQIAKRLAELKAFEASSRKDTKLIIPMLDDANRDKFDNIHAYQIMQVLGDSYHSDKIISGLTIDALRDYYQSVAKIEIHDDPVIMKCLDETCTKLDTEHKSGTITSWLKPKDPPAAVTAALAWKPRDSKDARIAAVSAENPTLEIKNSGSLSGKDLRVAQELVRDANIPDETNLSQFRDMLSLRPLGACCGVDSCRSKLAEKHVNLVPKNAAGATSK